MLTFEKKYLCNNIIFATKYIVLVHPLLQAIVTQD